MATASKSLFQTANYLKQKVTWPKDGKHILAQYNDDSIIVYQAFKPSIAEYAVKHQKCGWASKKHQDRVLAVTISRAGFNEILAHAYTAEKSRKLQTSDIEVRLQWDPDHTPSYEKCPRKAIQLGLKGKILMKYSTEWIQQIEDITDFVHEQKKILDSEGEANISVALETVYPVTDPNIAARIDLTYTEPAELVGFVS